MVVPTFGGGRELLRSLARGGQGWVGFEVMTPTALAARLARQALAREGFQAVDAFDRQALMDEALDGALASGPDAGLGELSEGVGFREAVHGSVMALRMAEVGPAELRAARLRDFRKRVFLARILERYETLLRERRRADPATILGLALAALEADGATLPGMMGADLLFLMPGLGTRGLAGRFLEALRLRGARTLETDPVVGLTEPESVLWCAGEPGGTLSFLHAPEACPQSAPSVQLFRAASITDELREVLRRVVSRGAPWDAVEIVTTDPAAYGSALHALATRLRIPVTYATGLPVERTRPGRVVHAYLDWIQGGFQAAPIRRLLEAGDLRPPRGSGSHAPADLARRFRQLRVGWGRRRYRTQIRRALEGLDARPHADGGFGELREKRVGRERSELQALRSILFPALKATPRVPDREGDASEPMSPAEVARGVRAFLRRVPPGAGADLAAREEILRVLDRVEATLRRRTHFEAAVTILRRHLEVRVRAPHLAAEAPDDLGAPWSSEGGHLHISDLEHGGLSGRKLVFVVGLDADRVPGGGNQDPVLPDSDRRVLGAGLPTSADLSRERAFRLWALLARLRGEVTLSHGAWNASEARVVAPSPVLLQALRLQRRDASLTYEDLHQALGEAACAVPADGSPLLDSDDVWMAALSQGGLLSAGTAAVRAAFTGLDRGLTAHEERCRGAPGPHHGVVTPRPDLLDPRRNEEVVLSASRLEDLGACPLRYFFRTVLRLYPPDDPELDPDRWLDALQKGSLLHGVFEQTLREAKNRGVTRTAAALEPLALEVLTAAAQRARDTIPSPGEGVVQRELAGLQEDVRSFVRMIREHGANWVKLEMKFGLDGKDLLVLPVARGTVRLRGAVDRVDEDLHGMKVIDYKTGVPRDYQSGKGVFNGGRRLQHALYAEAAERILGGRVEAGEYHFPTRKGENQIVPFSRPSLAAAPDLIGRMLDGVEAGTFVPTDSGDDCRFCDFAPVCRAKTSDWGKPEAPLADWSEEQLSLGLHPQFLHLRGTRNFEG
ncbi:MAG TPA: PD-(D/E)XK nuclease family protein [Longimicrobiales bacterium]|nr:PD-(D/E)XK nuclease family protein [Longimicrobiales bacterium]